MQGDARASHPCMQRDDRVSQNSALGIPHSNDWGPSAHLALRLESLTLSRSSRFESYK